MNKIGSNDKHDDLSEQLIHYHRQRNEEKHVDPEGIIWRFPQIHPQIVELVHHPRKKIQPIPLQLSDLERKPSEKKGKIPEWPKQMGTWPKGIV